jgi:hypothetical protein
MNTPPPEGRAAKRKSAEARGLANEAASKRGKPGPRAGSAGALGGAQKRAEQVSTTRARGGGGGYLG